MKETNKSLSYRLDPLIPANERPVTVELCEYEWGPNPNLEAKIVRHVWINVQDYNLGDFLFPNYDAVQAALGEFVEQHREPLTPELVAQLRELVATTRTTLFDDTVPLVKSKGARKPRRSTKRKDATLSLPFTPEPPMPENVTDDEDLKQYLNQWYRQRPIEEVREVAFGTLSFESNVEPQRRNYYRSAAVRVYVQLRANGQCEGCGLPAPFTNSSGQPYLESHHTIPVSQGGPDHPHWVIALCPTCHRHAHHANDAQDFNKKLMEIANGLEPQPVTKEPM